jgi:Ohr subfamily peroxiredoxin
VNPTYTAVAIAAGRDGRAMTSDGRLDVQLAMPKELGGTGDGTNPEQLFAAGWAACFSTTLHLIGEGRHLDTTGVAVTAEVSLVPEGPGFTLAAVLRVALPDHLSGESGAKLLEAAHRSCPYSRATRGNIPIDILVEEA